MVAKLKFEALDDDVRATFHNLEKNNQKLIEQNQRLASASRRGSRSAKTGMMDLAGAVAKVATGYLSVQSAIGLATKEFQTHTQVQQRAKQASLTLADAQAQSLVNLGATTREERNQFIDAIDRMSGAVKVPARDLYARASSALSARGELPVEKALQAVELSARFLPSDTAQGTELAGAILDLQKLALGRGKGIDANRALGFLMSTGQVARVVDPAKLAQNLSPALSGAMAAGADPRTAAATWAAFTGTGVDTTGAISKTATIQLAKKLQDFLPTKDQPVYDALGELRRTKKGTGLKTMTERVETLRADETRRRKFLAQATFPIEAQTAIESLLSGVGPAAKAFDTFRQTLPTMTEAGPLLDKRLAVMQGAPLQQTAQFSRALEATVERLETADQVGARSAIIRENLGRILEDTGLGWARTKLETLRTEAGGMVPEDFLGQIETARDRLRAPTRQAPMGGMIPRMRDIPREPTRLEERQADVLDQLLVEIRSLVVLQAEGNGDRRRANQRVPTGAVQGNLDQHGE